MWSLLLEILGYLLVPDTLQCQCPAGRPACQNRVGLTLSRFGDTKVPGCAGSLIRECQAECSSVWSCDRKIQTSGVKQAGKLYGLVCNKYSRDGAAPEVELGVELQAHHSMELLRCCELGKNLMRWLLPVF